MALLIDRVRSSYTAIEHAFLTHHANILLSQPGLFGIISFKHPYVCRIELSNLSGLTVQPRLQTQWGNEVRKFVTAYTRWLELFLTDLFHLMYFITKLI